EADVLRAVDTRDVCDGEREQGGLLMCIVGLLVDDKLLCRVGDRGGDEMCDAFNRRLGGEGVDRAGLFSLSPLLCPACVACEVGTAEPLPVFPAAVSGFIWRGSLLSTVMRCCGLPVPCRVCR